MDELQICLIVLLGFVCCSPEQISGSVLEVTVRPGDNITLYCDCTMVSSGVYIVWYRNCTHENQPTLVLSTKYKFPFEDVLNPFPRFHLRKNQSTSSYDLLIMNVTDSDEALYYCGTEEISIEGKMKINPRHVYTYSNVTRRILLNPDPSHTVPAVSWRLMFTPPITIISSLLIFILVYHFGEKTENNQRLYITKQNQDKDVFLTRVVFQAQDGEPHQ